MTRIRAGAERAADRHLALARRAAGEQQVRDVRARDQQHEADRAGQDQQRRPQIAGQLAVHRHQQRAPAGVELPGIPGVSPLAMVSICACASESETPGFRRAMALM